MGRRWRGRAVARAAMAVLVAGAGMVVLTRSGSAEPTSGALVQAAADAGGTYTPVDPTRILDTRDGTGAIRVGKVQTQETIELQVVGAAGVPANATAVVMNVTVTDPQATSYLTVWPSGAPKPTASNLNWIKDRTIPNLVVVRLGANGRVSIYNDAGGVDVIADVAGYFAPGSGVPGPPGPQGPPGVSGRVKAERKHFGVPAGGALDKVVECDTPGVVTAGGAVVLRNDEFPSHDDAQINPNARIVASYGVNDDGAQTYRGWRVVVSGATQGDDVYVTLSCYIG